MSNEVADAFEADPWAAAFAALEEKDRDVPGQDVAPGSPSAPESSASSDAAPGVPGGSSDAPVGGVSGAPSEHEGNAGEAGRTPERTGDEAGTPDPGFEEQPEVQQQPADVPVSDNSASIQEAKDYARTAAIQFFYQEIAKSGIRTSTVNGRQVLGASINDPDIQKKGSDGIPIFINPDTGREFTGDNPRKQAMDWVETYNSQIRDEFNQRCAAQEKQNLDKFWPYINALEFEKTYDTLNPTQKVAVDSLIKDYEVLDADGEVFGYSCDFNRILRQANGMISGLNQWASEHIQKTSSEPALDMKSAAKDAGQADPSNFKSLAEAIEFQQNQLLNKK